MCETIVTDRKEKRGENFPLWNIEIIVRSNNAGQHRTGFSCAFLVNIVTLRGGTRRLTLCMFFRNASVQRMSRLHVDLENMFHACVQFDATWCALIDIKKKKKKVSKKWKLARLFASHYNETLFCLMLIRTLFIHEEDFSNVLWWYF